MSPKILGCCTKCDKEVFDIVQKDPVTRLPIRLGAAHDDAVRVTFILADGTQMDLTFCKLCADGLEPHDFPFLWQRVMLSWESESPGHPNQKQHTDNAIMALSHAQPWKEVA